MYVITGATGNTGHEITKRLLAQAEKVRVIGRNAGRLQPLAANGAEPFVCELTDIDDLTRAFVGAQAVYVMIPPDLASRDYRSYQDRISSSIAAALERAGVQYAVALSSIGADKPDKTGPVVGLYNFEQKLNRIPGLNVLHLRAGYFMENTLAQIGIIKGMSTCSGPLRADLKLPMIATRDIGVVAADALLRRDFRGQQTRELLGQHDLSMAEAARFIGKAINKPGLGYVQLPDEKVRPALMLSGMSESVADAILEMSAALNTGYMRALEPRSPRNTTPTSFETFVAEEFVPRYSQDKPTAA
jgi:uncharacterized protein YbjT (DUF2867 family)